MLPNFRYIRAAYRERRTAYTPRKVSRNYEHSKIIYISFIIYIHSSIMTLTVSPPIIQKEHRSGFLPILRQRPALCGTLYRIWGVAALALPIGVTAGQLPVFACSSASDILSGESSYSHERWIFLSARAPCLCHVNPLFEFVVEYPVVRLRV